MKLINFKHEEKNVVGINRGQILTTMLGHVPLFREATNETTLKGRNTMNVRGSCESCGRKREQLNGCYVAVTSDRHVIFNDANSRKSMSLLLSTWAQERRNNPWLPPSWTILVSEMCFSATLPAQYVVKYECTRRGMRVGSRRSTRVARGSSCLLIIRTKPGC